MYLRHWLQERKEQLQKVQPSLDFDKLNLSVKSRVRVVSPESFRKTAGYKWPTINGVDVSGTVAAGISYINKNVDSKRVDAITAHEEMHQFFDAIEKEYGQSARSRAAKLLLSKASPLGIQYVTNGIREIGYNDDEHLFEEEAVIYFHSYMVDYKNRDRIQKSLGSDFLIKLADKEIKKSWKQIVSFALNLSKNDIVDPSLSKKVSADDWDQIKSSHDEDHMVDHTHHTDNSKVPDAYSEMLKSPNTNMGVNAGEEGVSPKMMHKIGKDIFMTKAYHKIPEDGTQTMNPFNMAGWASMAMRGLYDAGAIGHLCEEVHASEHKGVPITVHRFEPESLTVGQQDSRVLSRDYAFNPLHVQQIAAMDFLTNNLDRHHGNVIIPEESADKDARGYNWIKGIDHERAFQYAMPLRQTGRGEDAGTEEDPDTLGGYLESSALKYGLRDSYKFHGHDQLRDWWKENGGKIRKELDKHLLAVKDPLVRSHVRTNFHQRADAMDKWIKEQADRQDEGQESDLHNQFPGVNLIPIATGTDYSGSAELVSKLPMNMPKNGMGMLVKYLNGHKDSKKLNLEQQEIIRGAMKSMIEQMSPKTMTDFYMHSIGNPDYNTKQIKANPRLDPQVLIKQYLATPEKYLGKKPVYRTEHLSAFNKMIDELDSPRKVPLQIWKQKYEKLINKGSMR